MSATEKPFLQVVRGDATAEEIAALVAVLTARAQAAQGAAAEANGGRVVSRWADRARMVRGPVGEVARPRGAGAWRASALPR